jgi:hypothetical protein
VKVPVETSLDELQLYGKEEIAARSLKSVRSIEEDAADPACPLKWTHKAGKKNACDATTLRDYLAWLRLQPGRGRPPKSTKPVES